MEKFVYPFFTLLELISLISMNQQMKDGDLSSALRV
jgi:hypothetical protein